MKLLDKLDTVIMTLDGVTSVSEAGVPLTIGRALASCLTRGRSEDPVSAIQVAHKLMPMNVKNGEVTLEEAEFKLLKAAVTKDPNYFDLVKAELLQALDAATDPEEKKTTKTK